MEFSKRVSGKEAISQLSEKWSPLIDADGVSPIAENYKKETLAVLLENQEEALLEAAHTNNVGAGIKSTGGNANLAGYDILMMSMARRAVPNLMAFDTMGVQPMNGPTGMVFSITSRYNSQGGTEALHNEANTAFAGDPASSHSGTSPVEYLDAAKTGYTDSATGATGTGMSTGTGEKLGGPDSGDPSWGQMAFNIKKMVVEAKTYGLLAEFTVELQQDLQKVHNMDAESELANILSTEMAVEQNRQGIRLINETAEIGAQDANFDSAGTLDLSSDVTGRWSNERFAELLFQIDRECNQIAKRTRRGKGNFVICSSDVASALSMAGLLNSSDAIAPKIAAFNPDDTGNTYVGTLLGRIRVYVDPYFASAAGYEYVTVGYKGSSPWDAGIFYCPYVPLELMRAVGENTFQPKIAFKTRYGMCSNPFIGSQDGTIGLHNNSYFRIFRITNLLGGAGS